MRWITALEEAGSVASATIAWTLEAGSAEAITAAAAVAPRPEDLVHAARRRHPARRAATLERRLLLRALAARVLGAPAAGVSVSQAATEGPRVTAPTPLYAALAGRDGWTLAVVSPHPVGADVERVEPGAHRPLDLLHPAMARRLASADDRAFTGAWAATEAYLKSLGLGVDRLADVLVMDTQASWPAGGRPSATISLRWRGDHVFAVACHAALDSSPPAA